MTKAKGSPAKLRGNKKGGWGGKRLGAGRKRELKIEHRKLIAHEYFLRMQERRELASPGKPPRRELVIRELIHDLPKLGGLKHDIPASTLRELKHDLSTLTPRMIVRATAEFLPKFRENAAIWAYATKGMNRIKPLRPGKIERLKPGVYADKELRLVVDRNGNHKWIFRFMWRSIVRDMVLGGSEISLGTARERATKASRMVAKGQNPIDRSWLSDVLQKVKSKT